MSSDLDTFRILAEALALGLLVGAERYRGREPGEKKAAGVRTFAVFSLLGAICGMMATPVLTAVTFSAVAALVLVGYYRSPGDSLGMTTEVAALLVFWIGYLLNTREAAAIGLGIVLTIFLASKRPLHTFVREQISEAEFEATLKFLAVLLVIYPILPDRPVGPYDFFNPRQIWGMVILVSTISYVGYFLMRWLGSRRGLVLASVAGGIVSSTAVTMSLAERARSAPLTSRYMGAVAVLANAVQGPRLLLLLWVVNRSLARSLALPLIGMAVVGIASGWLMSRRTDRSSKIELPVQNPYSLGPAVKFGLFFATVLLLVELASSWFGNPGVLIASAIAGAASTSAVALSVSGYLEQDPSVPLIIAQASVIAAIATNSIGKCAMARLNGTRQMVGWLAVGLVAMLSTALLLMLVQVR